MWRVSGSCLSCWSALRSAFSSIASGPQLRATAMPASGRKATRPFAPDARTFSSIERDVPRRQVERERRALALLRAHLDLAAQEARDLAADRQPEPRAAVAARGAAVRLLERLEDQAQLVVGNADAGVGHLDREDAFH